MNLFAPDESTTDLILPIIYFFKMVGALPRKMGRYKRRGRVLRKDEDCDDYEIRATVSFFTPAQSLWADMLGVWKHRLV